MKIIYKIFLLGVIVIFTRFFVRYIVFLFRYFIFLTKNVFLNGPNGKLSRAFSRVVVEINSYVPSFGHLLTARTEKVLSASLNGTTSSTRFARGLENTLLLLEYPLEKYFFWSLPW